MKLEAPFDEAGQALHDTLAGLFAANIDVAIVCVAHEPVATTLKFAIQLVQHEVRKQGRERTALRDSLPICLEEPVVEHARRQVAPDEPEQPPIRDARRHRGDQPVVVDPVEELGQVDVHDKLIACDDIGLRLRHRLVGGAARPEAEAVLAERRVPQRLELLENRLLDHAINRGWNAKVARPAGRLRDGYPTHRLRLVAPLEQLSFDFRPARLENSGPLFDGDPVNAGAPLLRTTARKAASRLSGAQIASMRWLVDAGLSGSAVAVTASTSCASGRGASLRPGMGKANSSWQGGRNGVMRRSDLLTLSFNPFRGPFGPSAGAPAYYALC